MEYSKLIASLKLAAEQLSAQKISEIDFQQLGSDLQTAGSVLESLLARTETSDKLIGLFKEELTRKARATARLTGRQAHLVEKLINSDNLNLTELVSLKRDIDGEFDAVFSRKLSEPTGAASGGEKVVEFKV